MAEFESNFNRDWFNVHLILMYIYVYIYIALMFCFDCECICTLSYMNSILYMSFHPCCWCRLLRIHTNWLWDG